MHNDGMMTFRTFYCKPI